MWRCCVPVLWRSYHVKPALLATTDYKTLNNSDFMGFLRSLNALNYVTKSAPKHFDFRAFELHSIERIDKTPRLAIDFILEYLALNRGTEACLGDICEVVRKHFGALITDPLFEKVIQRLSVWTLALNKDLLHRTCDYFDNSLQGNASFFQILKTMVVCANNCARLETHGKSEAIRDLVLPLHDKACEKLETHSGKTLKGVNNYSKASCFYALKYLDKLSATKALKTRLESKEAIFDIMHTAADRMKTKAEPSSAQREVCKLLNSHGIKFVEEKRIDYYYVDVFIEPNFVIEFDGKIHYFSNTHILKGEQLVKVNCLKHCNYNVICINYQDWQTTEGRKQVMDQILLELGIEDNYIDK